MTSKIFIDMAASFWFFLSFLAKSISFYFRNQIYTALGFQKYSHCNKVLYISPWTIPFYTSDVSLLTKQGKIVADKTADRSKVARDGRPKFRKARDTVEAKRSKVFLGKAKSSPEKKEEAKELQWSFANCLRRSAVKREIIHQGLNDYECFQH